MVFTTALDVDFNRPPGAPGNALEYPRYTNLIDYELVTDGVREVLQPEPAFHFLKGTADLDEYEISLEIKTGVVFTFDRNGLPCWRVVGESMRTKVGPIVDVQVASKACTIRVKPSKWDPIPLVPSPNVITLRLYSSDPATPSSSYYSYGVSVTFIRPGTTLATPSAFDPTGARQLEIDVTAFTPQPVYNLFKTLVWSPGLNPPVSLEPAFHLTPSRPVGRLQVNLSTTPATQFVKAPVRGDRFPDDVDVWARIDGRPAGLSSAKFPTGDPKKMVFDFGVGRGPKVYGFGVNVEQTALTDEQDHHLIQLVEDPSEVSGERRREPPRRRERHRFHVDPILFEDPPPTTVP